MLPGELLIHCRGLYSIQLFIRFLNHPVTQELYRELLDLAKRGVAVAPNTMTRLTKELLCTLHLKNPHRQEIWGLFTRGHYIDAVTGGDAAFPFVDTSQARVEEGNGQVVNTEWGEVYVRDPHRADPGVARDPLGEDAREVQEENEPRNLRVGRCTTVNAHKTGRKYPAYVFFTLYDVVWLRAYEEIRKNFLDSIGQDPTDNSQAFFINAVGGSLITRNRGLDWTRYKGVSQYFRNKYYYFYYRFMMVNQCGPFKGHTARKIISDYVKKQNIAVLSEGKSSSSSSSSSNAMFLQVVSTFSVILTELTNKLTRAS